jgi:hypothetical protein
MKVPICPLNRHTVQASCGAIHLVSSLPCRFLTPGLSLAPCFLRNSARPSAVSPPFGSFAGLLEVMCASPSLRSYCRSNWDRDGLLSLLQLLLDAFEELKACVIFLLCLWQSPFPKALYLFWTWLSDTSCTHLETLVSWSCSVPPACVNKCMHYKFKF